MHRSIIESFVSCAVSLAIAVAVFVAGTSTIQTSAQPATSPSSRAASLEPAAMLPPAQTTAGNECRKVSILALANSGVQGRAELCVTSAGIQSRMEVEGLTVGHAYTVQLAYFDRSASCGTPVCEIDDTLGENPAGVLARMDGGVASDGAAAFGGDFRDLHPALGSQIVLFLFENGPASSSDNRTRARQLLTPRSPKLGAPAAGAVADGEAGLPVGYAAFEFRPDP
jgi:hypothetical protein